MCSNPYKVIDREQLVLLSTAHITQKDAELLESNILDPGILFLSREDEEAGYLIQVDIIFPDIDYEGEDRKKLQDKGFSQSFLNLIDWCLKEDISYLRLAHFGSIIEELPQHDW